MQVSGTSIWLPVAITRTKTWHRYKRSCLARKELVPCTLEPVPGFKVKIPLGGGNLSQPINMPVPVIHPHANGDQGVPLNHPALMRCQYKGSHRVKNHSCQVCQPGDNERMEVLNAGCKHRGILEFPGYRSQLARYVSLFFTCLGFSNDIHLVSDVNQCIPFNLRVAEIDPASELLIIQQVVTA